MAKQNNAKVIRCAVGVMYGTDADLSGHYKALRSVHQYDVFVGTEFWYRLTGSKNFYHHLIDSFQQAAIAAKGKDFLEQVIVDLAADIRLQSKTF